MPCVKVCLLLKVFKSFSCIWAVFTWWKVDNERFLSDSHYVYKWRLWQCEMGIENSCIPDKIFHDFHQYWQILFYIPISDPCDGQKTNNNTCCQYIGCIGGHVTLSLRHCSWRYCDVTYDINFQYGGRQRKATWLVHGDSYVKCWRSKRRQE